MQTMTYYFGAWKAIGIGGLGGGELSSLYSGLLRHPAANLLCQACHSSFQHLALSLGEMAGDGASRRG